MREGRKCVEGVREESSDWDSMQGKQQIMPKSEDTKAYGVSILLRDLEANIKGSTRRGKSGCLWGGEFGDRWESILFPNRPLQLFESLSKRRVTWVTRAYVAPAACTELLLSSFETIKGSGDYICIKGHADKK